MRLFITPCFIILLLLFSGGINPDTENDIFPFYSGSLHSELFLAAGDNTDDIYLVKDSLQNPLFYYSNVLTPVCYDNTCKPLQIKVFWDVCGTFLGFKVPEDVPLTKKDHKPFSKLDYYTLYSILNNPAAEISKMNKPDLVNYNSISEVDAISGATSSEAQQFVVPGAAYSTYTLWHLVNGKTFETRTEMNEKHDMEYWKDRFRSLQTLPPGELAPLLFEADRNKILRKYQIQQLIVSKLDSMPVLNALLINNYLRRQPFVAKETEEKIKRCASIKLAFNGMLPAKDI